VKTWPRFPANGAEEACPAQRPGNANLPIGDLRHANREIGVPGGRSLAPFQGRNM